MKAADFLNQVDDPADWLVSLMPSMNPADTEIFQESEMGKFVNWLALVPNQDTLVIGATISQRNWLYKKVDDALQSAGLVRFQNEVQIVLSTGTRVNFLYLLSLLVHERIVGHKFSAVLLGDPDGTPEVL